MALLKLDIGGVIWIPAYGNVIVGETSSGTTNLQSVMEGPSGTAAANVSVFDPLKGTLTFDSGDAYVTIEMAYMLLSALTVGETNEVPGGTNLTGAEWTVAVYSAQG